MKTNYSARLLILVVILSACSLPGESEPIEIPAAPIIPINPPEPPRIPGLPPFEPVEFFPAIACTATALIEAINDANRDPGPDNIILPWGCTISLSEVNNSEGGAGPNGTPVIHTPITITGYGFGLDVTTVERNSASGVPTFRLFYVSSAGQLTLNSGQYLNGVASQGGGIYNAGVLNLLQANLSNHTATADGGALYNVGTANLRVGMINLNRANQGGGIFNAGGIVFLDDFGWIAANVAEENGGGIFNDAGGQIFGSSNIQANAANNRGGGIFNRGEVELDNTGRLTYRNEASAGGFIWNSGMLRLLNFAAWENQADEGGVLYNEGEAELKRNSYTNNFGADAGAAIFNTGSLRMVNSTISGNQTTTGTASAIRSSGTLSIQYVTIANNGGSGAALSTVGGSVEISNTIVAGNSGGDCSLGGSVSLIGTNLDTDGSCTGFPITADPLLSGLGLYGSAPLQGHALLPGSPAIDTASGPCPGSDQVSNRRPAGAACDIGALEMQPPAEERGVIIILISSSDTFCFWGPGQEYGTVNSVLVDTDLTLIGVAEIEGWLIVESHIFSGVACWVPAEDFDTPPDLDLSGLPEFPVPPVPEEPAEPDEPPSGENPDPSAPNAPSGLQVETICQGSTYNVILTWNDNSNNESGFRIYRDGVLIGTVGANTTQFTDTNISDSNPQNYTVRAYNGFGESSSIGAQDEGCIF